MSYNQNNFYKRKNTDLLFYIVLAYIIYKIIVKIYSTESGSDKENFAPVPSAANPVIIVDKNQLDATKYYDVGTIKAGVSSTQTPGINSTVTCNAFPTTIYRLSATVDPVCATNQDTNYTFGATPQLGSALRV
jgi:hypothetical protein